jgi:hypothetical protein
VVTLCFVMYTAADGYETRGGMSGGGVFDGKGRFIGVHVGKNRLQPSRQVRVEFLRTQWKDLLEGRVETLETR